MFGYGFQYSKTDTGNAGKVIANAYEVRVLADGGVYENSQCLIRFLNRINIQG